MYLSTSVLLNVFSTTLYSLNCVSFLITYWLTPESLTMDASAFVFFLYRTKMLKLEDKQFSCSSNKLCYNLFSFLSPSLLITVRRGCSSSRKDRSYVTCSFKRLREMQDINQEIGLNDYWGRYSVTHHVRRCFSQFAISITQVLFKSTDES